MTRTLLIAVSLLGSAVFQTAQPARIPPPDVDLGDTRGADFDTQAVGTATPADFDFLVGTWNFQFQQQAEPGKDRPTQTGVWTVQNTHDGHIVEDVWRLGTTPPTRRSRIACSIRRESSGKFKARSRSEAGGRRHRVEPGERAAPGPALHLVGAARPASRYFDITDTSFRWRADGSSDQGKTWTPDIWKMRATRTGENLPRRM